jgi:recombination protein RecT
MNAVTVSDERIEQQADAAAAATETRGKALTVAEQLQEVRLQFDRMIDLKDALPAHIPLERFRRVAMTAIQNNPDLIVKCSRRSLFLAFLRAAQDGLLPDGREGAVVPYKDQAQWLPMVAGIRKKVRNSGEVTTWDCYLVYEADQFEARFGLNPDIVHVPNLINNRGAIVACYAVATLKTGEKSFELMTIGEIEAIRKKASRSKCVVRQ